jgi:hypothetical protein
VRTWNLTTASRACSALATWYFSSSAGQGSPCRLWNLKFHDRFHNRTLSSDR